MRRIIIKERLRDPQLCERPYSLNENYDPANEYSYCLKLIIIQSHLIITISKPTIQNLDLSVINQLRITKTNIKTNLTIQGSR